MQSVIVQKPILTLSGVFGQLAPTVAPQVFLAVK